MRVLTADQMRRVDRRAMAELGLPGSVLMENAALGVVEAVAERFPQVESAAIFCGPGNNGGDGLAVGRLLATRGYEVVLYLVLGGPEPSGPGGSGRAMAGDAARQLEICRRLGLEIVEILSEAQAVAALEATVSRADLAIDALFGTGLSRPLTGVFACLAVGLARLPAPVLAVDIPSGLDASLSSPIGPHARARCTVTFAVPKVAHVFSPAAEAVGELVVADLGFPSSCIEVALQAQEAADQDLPVQLHLMLASELAAFVLPRPREGHKGTFGHLLLCAGSPGRSGAAVLAARAAVKGGAGLVTVAVPEPVLDLVDGGSLESMTAPLPAGEGGALSAAAVEPWLALAEGKSALAVGPGLAPTPILSSPRGAQGVVAPGPEAPAWEGAVRDMVVNSDLPLVLDADGINAFAGRAEVLRRRQAPLVLTPHPGELARLLTRPVPVSGEDRCGAARDAARATGSILVLKGHQTLVATPEGEVFINPTGNAGMATGGSGDVLTGLIGALLAQGYEALAAAQLGVFLHGDAGDRGARRHGEAALTASDILKELANAQLALVES